MIIDVIEQEFNIPIRKKHVANYKKYCHEQ